MRRALMIKEAQLGTEDLQVAFTLQELARCVREEQRPGEAEALIRRALAIKEAKLGEDDVQVTVVLEPRILLCGIVQSIKCGSRFAAVLTGWLGVDGST